MRRNLVIALAAICIFGTAVGLAGDDKDSAAKLFADGKAALAKANFDQALTAFKAAAAADPKNEEFTGELALLKRVVNMRKLIAEEKEPEAWTLFAKQLYAYYRDHKLGGEALTLAKSMHAKMNNADSINALGDAQIAAGANAEAVEFLGKLADKATPHTQAMYALALGRTGKLDQAKTIAAKLELPKEANGDTYWDTARLYAAIGDNEKAIKTLQTAFETTPPVQLVSLKADAKTAPEFAKIAATPEFTKALETASKMKAGGCAGCPMAGKDGGCEEGKAGEKKEGGCAEHEKAGAPAKDAKDGAKEKK